MADIDVVFVNQILNEVVNGFSVPNFEGTLGATQASANELLTRVHRVAVQLESDSQLFTLSKEETRFFRKAFEATLEELGDDEFETRTGYPHEQGITKLAALPE